MKYNDLVLRGRVIKKKEPVPYEFQGRKGFSYSVFIDSFEDIYELKVPQDVYDSCYLGNYYAFSCSVNIDRSNKDNNNLVIKSIILCTGNNEVDLVPKTPEVYNQESLPLSTKSKTTKDSSN